ncbi:MAG: sulfatase-like hydrolase/transferase, partial [Bacteroidota bacterium]
MLICIACISISCQSQTQTDQPNVLLILSDDQGTLDLNSYGATDLDTPHLDDLAKRGIRFTQFYAAAPVCSPSRAAILTGRYPQRNGVVGNSGTLHSDETTIAEMLKAGGYATGQFGKWHIGHGRPNAEYAQAPGPNAEGFDVAVGFLSGVVDYWSHFNYGGAPWGDPPRRHDLHRNGEEIWRSGTHTGDLIVDETLAFIDNTDGQPFFAYAAFGSPHYPMQPYDRYMAHYAHLPMQRRQYAALVSTMDEQIGRLLEGLKTRGLDRNTLVIFMSDHGHSTEARADFGGGYAGPFRGAKFSLLEGGIRVPAIVSLPGTIPTGDIRHHQATGMDWLPTIAAYTNTQLPENAPDGKSLYAIIQDPASEEVHERLFWHRPHAQTHQWAVREGSWKLVRNGRDTDGSPLAGTDTLFLSNLTIDSTETTNLAAQHPGRVAQLTL